MYGRHRHLGDSRQRPIQIDLRAMPKVPQIKV